MVTHLVKPRHNNAKILLNLNKADGRIKIKDFHSHYGNELCLRVKIFLSFQYFFLCLMNEPHRGRG